MLSRIADSMFWLNRYMERSEAMLRMIHTNYVLTLDADSRSGTGWKPVLDIFAALSEDTKMEASADHSRSLRHLILDPRNLNSLRTILSRARENARGMQDHITKEVWEQVNLIYHSVNSPGIEKKLEGNEAISQVEYLLKNCLLYTGITDSTMPRGMSWNFMSLGKYLERCLLTLELADKNYALADYDLGKNKDILFWRSLLFSLSGYELHLKSYRNTDYNINVAHQVIFNPLFPHSIMYSLTRLKKYLDDVVKENNPSDKYSLLKQFGRLYSNVEFADFEWVRRNGLKAYLDEIRQELFQFNRSLSLTFFSYS